MRYFIGIDGGGTKSHCVLCDENLNVMYESKSGPTNFLMIGTDTVANTIVNQLEECIKNQNITFDDVEGIVLGTTGAGRRSNAEQLENAIINLANSKGINFSKFRVESDARIALEGSFSGKPGSILIAGTGSIMFGKDSESNIHRIGGYGRWIGDEGSGFSIGKKGFIAIAKEYDGRGSQTTLSDLVKENFSIASAEQLINKIYSENFDIASIAIDVVECANKGDEVCQQILKEEATELFWHVVSCLKKLNLKTLDLSLIGSLLTNDNYYSKLFKEMVNKNLPQVTIKEPDYIPAVGAVLMAKDL